MTIRTPGLEEGERLDPVTCRGPIDTECKSRARFIAWFAFVVAAGWIALIWTYRFLPLQDYPAWIYTGQVFSQLIRNQAPPFYSIVHWPVPNATFVAFLGVSDLFFRPETSGKIFLTLCVMLYVFGSYRLVGSMTTRRDSPLFLLPLLYVFHRSILVGELAFSFGLAVLLLAMAYVFAVERPRLWAVAGFSLLIFSSHAIAFFCWLICLAVLAVLEPSKLRTPKLLLATSPSLLVMVWYALARAHSASASSGPSFLATLRMKLTIISVFSPLHFFDPFYSNDSKLLEWIAIVFNLFGLSVVGAIAATWLRRVCRQPKSYFPDARGRAAVAVVAMFFAAFLFAPFASLTGVPDANYRFVLPMFVLMLGSLAASKSAPWASERMRWVLGLLAATAVACVLLFYFVDMGRISNQLQQVNDVISRADLNPDFRELTNTEVQDLASTKIQHMPLVPNSSWISARILPIHAALDYFTYYFRTERQVRSLVFPTSIIRSSLVYTPLLDSNGAMTALPSAIVISGEQAANRANAGLIRGPYETAVDSEYVMILKQKEENVPHEH